MMFELFESKITGTQISYYVLCKRKLWLFSHQIQMEKFSDDVVIGHLIAEESFRKEKFKEFSVGDTFKIDFLKIGNEVIVHEVKKSKKLEEAHILQVKFYIYCLRKYGINSNRGIIHYPKLLKKVEVEYTKKDDKQIELALAEIPAILKSTLPQVNQYPYCKKCAYYEFCYI